MALSYRTRTGAGSYLVSPGPSIHLTRAGYLVLSALLKYEVSAERSPVTSHRVCSQSKGPCTMLYTYKALIARVKLGQ